MPWYKTLATWIEKRGGRRDLMREVDGKTVLYMSRYYIMKCKFFEVMLHNFHLGDRPDFHDHPWASGGVILAEGYREHTLSGIAEKKPGNWGFRGAKDFHWVELRPNTEGKVWTLFFTGPRVREWGFLVNNTWIHFKDYFKNNGTLPMQQLPEVYKGLLFPRKVR